MWASLAARRLNAAEPAEDVGQGHIAVVCPAFGHVVPASLADRARESSYVCHFRTFTAYFKKGRSWHPAKA